MLVRAMALAIVATLFGATPKLGHAEAGRAPAAKPSPAAGVATELVNRGARSVFVYVVAAGRASSAVAGNGPPRNSTQRFRVGSVTKTFVAAIVLRLAEEGKLGLDDPVERYLPRTFPLGSTITLRELLNHTSGIANFTDFGDWLAKAEKSKTVSPLDVVRFAATKPRTFARPGASWAYSNTNYIALGLVVEKVTGHSLRQELARRITQPLGLTETELASTRKLPDLRDPGTNPNLPWAAGGIVSSAADLVRFFSALLSERVISQAPLNEMEQTIQDPTGPGRYGLGLAAIDLPCGRFWGHFGGILDYGTAVVASPDGRRVA